jgi:hypothetical protein
VTLKKLIRISASSAEFVGEWPADRRFGCIGDGWTDTRNRGFWLFFFKKLSCRTCGNVGIRREGAVGNGERRSAADFQAAVETVGIAAFAISTVSTAAAFPHVFFRLFKDREEQLRRKAATAG